MLMVLIHLHFNTQASVLVDLFCKNLLTFISTANSSLLHYEIPPPCTHTPNLWEKRRGNTSSWFKVSMLWSTYKLTKGKESLACSVKFAHVEINHVNVDALMGERLTAAGEIYIFTAGNWSIFSISAGFFHSWVLTYAVGARLQGSNTWLSAKKSLLPREPLLNTFQLILFWWSCAWSL